MTKPDVSARDELQQWVEGVTAQGVGYDFHIPMDLARRVLAEMDDLREELRKQILRRDDQYDRRKIAEFERDAALAKLDAVQAWAQNGEAYIRGGQRKELFRILDGEGASDG